MTDFIELTHDTLDVSKVNNTVMTDGTTGATSMFIGTTRDNFEGKTVVKLEYEAYVPMAEKEIKKICTLIRSKYKEVHNIAVSHRLGVVPRQEASIIIAINSAHRKDSLEAVHFAIDELKAKVPIWKKEIYEEGDNNDSVWKENKECKWSNNVQINASKEEIERRINSFIKRKREEIDYNNVREFCNKQEETSSSNDFSCARTDAIMIAKRENSSSHLRKSKVLNSSGPSAIKAEIKQEYDESTTATKSSSSTSSTHHDIPDTLNDRLNVLESHIAPGKPVPKDVYSRIKALEDRVLFLEGVSPEYFKINGQTKVENKNSSNDDAILKSERNAMIQNSLININSRIRELETSISIKQESNVQSE